MKRRILFFSLLLLYCSGYASDFFNLADSVQQARKYSTDKDYLIAARLFEKCAEEAKSSTLTYLQNLHSASENYYMLDDYIHVKYLCDEYAGILASANIEDEEKEYYGQRLSKMLGTYFYGQTSADTSDYSFREAEKYYMAAINDFGDKEFDKVLYLDIAQLYYKWKRYSDAVHYLDLAASLERGSDLSGILCSKAMCLARMHDFKRALSLIDSVMGIQIESEQYEGLRQKAKILMMQYDTDGTDNIAVARSCYEKYVRYQIRTMAKRLDGMSELQREQYWLKLHDSLTDCCRLGDGAPELLYDLVLFFKGYLVEYRHAGDNVQLVKWQQVQNILQYDEAAVEFLQYNARNDEPRLGALVLKAGMENPVFIDIASVDAITFCAQSRTDDKIWEIVWNDSMRRSLKDVNKIFFAADGILNKCPIEYHHPDSITCVRLSSTKVLVRKRRSINTSEALLCGGIDYSSPKRHDYVGNDEISYQTLRRISPVFFYLPGTKSELDSILQSRKNHSDLILEGAEASDVLFCSIAGKFPCLHVATHGYYVNPLNTGTDIKPLTIDESLSCSGLVFAGASYALRDTAHIEGQSDGLLSAKELSQLDLSNTDLVVLSACQSAQGEVTSDGIYGLQRALKLAGAKAIIASLWDVDDISTAFLMCRFYENLEKCDSAHEAFMQARKQLQESRVFRFSSSSLSSREIFLYNNPRYYDAFIMIDVI